LFYFHEIVSGQLCSTCNVEDVLVIAIAGLSPTMLNIYQVNRLEIFSQQGKKLFSDKA